MQSWQEVACEVRCRWVVVQCDTIGSSDTLGFHNTLGPHNQWGHLRFVMHGFERCAKIWVNQFLDVPSSLSFLSEQSCSRLMSQPGPNHPDSHQHSHSRLWLVLHCPWPLQFLGHPARVQCFPFQPLKINLRSTFWMNPKLVLVKIHTICAEAGSIGAHPMGSTPMSQKSYRIELY